MKEPDVCRGLGRLPAGEVGWVTFKAAGYLLLTNELMEIIGQGMMSAWQIGLVRAWE